MAPIKTRMDSLRAKCYTIGIKREVSIVREASIVVAKSALSSKSLGKKSF